MTIEPGSSNRRPLHQRESPQGLLASVVAKLSNGMFRLRMSDGKEVVGHVSCELRMALTRLLVGDQVLVDLSPFDPAKARIRSLFKSAPTSQHQIHPIQPQQREQS